MTDDEGGLKCWLCCRPFGTNIQWHHTVPKSKKGRATVPVHPICHKTIHLHFSNAELARFGDDREMVLAQPDIGKFVQWVKSKPPDFHVRVKRRK